MTYTHTLKAAVKALSAHKTRSFLTILGIVIGITSIILVMSLGAGAQELILGQIEGLGSKTVVVVPGREPRGPSDSAQVFSDSLKERDLTALQSKANVPTAELVMPILMGGDTGTYLNETYRLTIFAGNELMPELFGFSVDNGVFFGAEDVRARADVVVLGSKVKNELFGDNEALGERIRIKGRNLRVIGVLDEQGSSSFVNFDEAALVPYTNAQQYIFGIKYFHRFFIRAESDATVERTVEDVEVTLRSLHNIDDPEKDDFFVSTQKDLAERIGTITTAFTFFLVAVASIALLVGGVGIMNIMLVSVTERTREIGLRKALGATEKDILRQFLAEAVMLTGFGGAVGVLLGAFLGFVIAMGISYGLKLDWSYSFPIGAAILGVGVAAVIGLVFGIYPAREAAKKSPMEALRYE